MATTNMPSNATTAEAARLRSEEERRAVADANRKNADVRASGNDQGDDLGDLDQQARDAVEHRATSAFDSTMAGARARLNEELKTADQGMRERREADFNAYNKQMREKYVADAMAVYEDAIKRRGARQAAMDQMQAAVGLPSDPRARQAEIERRTSEGAAAMSAQSGVGTVQAHLDGTMERTRLDEFQGDPARAEFNPHVQEGHGQNIAAMAQASGRLMAIAPGAPMTQENVNDPHGAIGRMEEDKAKQRNSQPRMGFQQEPQQSHSNVTASTPGGKTPDPLLPNRNAQPGGLTPEQLAQRDKVAGGSDPS